MLRLFKGSSRTVAALVTVGLALPLAPVAASAAGPGALPAPASAVAGTVLPAKLASQPSAKPGAFNKVRITWKGASKKTKVTVQGAASYKDLLKSKTRFTATAKYVKANTFDVAIPAKFKAQLGGNAGNLLYLYVNAKDGKQNRKSKMLQTWVGGAKAKGAARNKLTYATYNIAGIQATSSMPSRVWEKRRGSVVNAIVKSNADVISIQEASLSKASNGLFQVQDLTRLLKPKGYDIVVADNQIWPVNYSKQNKMAYVYYKTSTVNKLASGMAPQLSGTTSGRWFTWAKLQSKRSGKVFFAASVHLTVGGSSAQKAERMKQVRNVQAIMAKKAGRLPVIVAGDFNSHYRKQANGPDVYMVSKGWQSAGAAAKKSGYQYMSTNGESNGGYGAKPVKQAPMGTHIDFIFSKNTGGAVSYTNQVILKNGKFVEAYRGSDHNLQKAVIYVN